MIDQAESRDVYFESNSNEAEIAESEQANNAAEEVRLSGISSRSLDGDLLLVDNEAAEKKKSEKTKSIPDGVEQTRTSSEKHRNATSSVKKEVEATKSAEEKNSSHSLTNSSREVKESDSKGKKESKRLMSSPWILILTILFLFILACIILAVLR